MSTLLLTHPDCLEHLTPTGHPERPDRLRAIDQVLSDELFNDLRREDAPLGDLSVIERVHPRRYIEAIKAAVPAEGMVALDMDTSMSPKSLDAALRAVGAATRAVDEVMSGAVSNAFCATRPPGHHAEHARPMGFCLFANAAIAAHHARAAHGAERVAVVDFDVHHGNGTQAIFWDDADMFYASTHEMPLFPGTGALSETGAEGNICNAPLRAGDDGYHYRQAMQERIFAELDEFCPDVILISAGFDAHERDPLSSVRLAEPDYAWTTLKLAEIAERHAKGRMVSMLEGGYDLLGLAKSVGVHVHALMEVGS